MAGTTSTALNARAPRPPERQRYDRNVQAFLSTALPLGGGVRVLLIEPGIDRLRVALDLAAEQELPDVVAMLNDNASMAII